MTNKYDQALMDIDLDLEQVRDMITRHNTPHSLAKAKKQGITVSEHYKVTLALRKLEIILESWAAMLEL